MIIRFLILTILMAGTAYAEPYVSFGGGITSPGDLEEPNGITTFNAGTMFNGSVGYRFDNIRVEIEGLQSRSPRDTFTEIAQPPPVDPCILNRTCPLIMGNEPTGQKEAVQASGTDTVTAAMWNVLIGIPTKIPVEPYLGGGIGFGGYQFMTGADIKITDSWAFELRYRFFGGDYDIHSLNTVLTYYFGELSIK